MAAVTRSGRGRGRPRGSHTASMHAENIQITFDANPNESRKRKSENMLTIRQEKLTRFQDNTGAARKFSSAVSYTQQADIFKGQQGGLGKAAAQAAETFQEFDQRQAARDGQIDAQTELFQEVYHLQKKIDSTRGRSAAAALTKLQALSGEELYDDTIAEVREHLVDDKKLEKEHQQARKDWKAKLQVQKQASARYNSLELRAEEEEAAGDELVLAAQMGGSPRSSPRFALDDVDDIVPSGLDDIVAGGGNIKMKIISAGSSRGSSRAGSLARSTTPPKSRAQAPERERGEVYVRDLSPSVPTIDEENLPRRGRPVGSVGAKKREQQERSLSNKRSVDQMDEYMKIEAMAHDVNAAFNKPRGAPKKGQTRASSN